MFRMHGTSNDYHCEQAILFVYIIPSRNAECCAQRTTRLESMSDVPCPALGTDFALNFHASFDYCRELRTFGVMVELSIEFIK